VDNFTLNFGVGSLAAILKRDGHDVQVLNYTFSKLRGIDIYRNPEKYFSFDRIAAEVLGTEPDIIAFSAFAGSYMFCKRLAKAIRKKSDTPLLVGGILATLRPDLFTEGTCCDFLFKGEAEPIISELVERIGEGTYHSLPNLVYRDQWGGTIHNKVESFVEDLDALPFYDKTLYQPDSLALPLLSGRGCSYSCTYCSAHGYSKTITRPRARRIRKRSVGSLIKEIVQALETREYNEVVFWDDCFVSSREWLREFADRYKEEIALPYFCTAVPALDVLKRKESKVRVAKVISLLREHGIQCMVDHIFNFPGETREHIGESLDFYIDNKVRSLNIAFLNYYPGTEIVQYAFDNGHITPEQFSAIESNEMIGEQSFKGTITNEKTASEKVQYAFLFKLINLLPGSWLRWLFRNRAYKLFPTNRFAYYTISVISQVRGMGFANLLKIFRIGFEVRKGAIKKRSPLKSGLRLMSKFANSFPFRR
jgi:radical SAM superfamily enzyme YgiQ (UPF0313 family)